MIHVIVEKRAFCDVSVRPVSIQLLTLSPVIKVNLSRCTPKYCVVVRKKLKAPPPKLMISKKF